MVAAAPAIFTTNNFRLSDRVKIQCDMIRRHEYIVFGRLTAVVFEAQRNTMGLSQSLPRYTNPAQARAFDDAVKNGLMSSKQADAMKPFSEKQNVLWQSTTLDWLDAKRGPLIARSKDKRDWLLPGGLTPLPSIPHPKFVPSHARDFCPQGKTAGCPGCTAPRIPQPYVGCPVVGNRVEHKITARNGYTMGVVHPVLELSIVVWTPDGQGHFVRLRGGMDNVDRSRPALLIDDQDRGFFVGGIFA